MQYIKQFFLSAKVLDTLCFLFLVFAAILFYLRTLIPGLGLGDSAEFQVLAHTLGMSHPTGYPIYLLFAKLFSILPLGNIAYKVNLLSAFCAAATVGLVYLASRLIGAGKLAALIAALSLGLAGVFWKQAIIAEIYTPAAMLLAAIIVCLLAWARYSHACWLFFAGIFGSISLGVHITILLFAPAVLIYLILRARRWQDWGSAILGVCLGLIFWISAFLIIDAQKTPTSYYESVVRVHLSGFGLADNDFDLPFERLHFMLTGSQFRASMFSGSPAVVGDAIREYRYSLEFDFSIILRCLGAVGFLVFFLPTGRENNLTWREGLLLLVGYLTTLFFIINYHIPDIYNFYIPAYVYFSIASALGFRSVTQIGTIVLARKEKGQLLFSKVASGLLGIVLLVSVFLPRMPVIVQAWEHKTIQHPFIRENPPMISDILLESAQRVTNSLEDDAILFSGWMELYTYFYITSVLNDRNDIHIHEIHPKGTLPGISDSMLAYIDENISQHPIYISHPIPELHHKYELIPTANHLFRLGPR